MTLLFGMDKFTPLTETVETVAIEETSKESLVKINPSLAVQIERGWVALLSYRDIAVNDTLLRVTDISPELVTVSADIDYRAVVGARYCSAVADTPYQALSAMAVTITSDKQLVLFIRDSGDWPKSFECVGGFVRARFSCATVEDFIEARCARELAALSINKTALLGSYQLVSIAEHMFIYRYQVKENAETVRQLYPSAQTVPLSTVPALLQDTSRLPWPLHAPTAQVLQALYIAKLLY